MRPVSFRAPHHERVYALLRRLISEGAAHFYADAHFLANQRPPLRTASHLVGHLVREVESATRQVLVALPEAQGRLTAQTKADAGHLGEIRAILGALKIDTDSTALAWESFAGKNNNKGWHYQAHRNDLQFPRALDEVFQERFELFCRVLAVVLDAAEADYASTLAAFSPLMSRSEPSAEDVAALKNYLAPGVTALMYVFATLPAGWLVPLRNIGAFQEPPGIVEGEDGQILPSWPQAGYLERVAADSPAEVATTIESIPEVDNEMIHWTLLRAALRMPGQEASRVTRHELRWIASRPSLGHAVPHAIEQLVQHLLQQGETGVAVDLLRVVLAFPPTDGKSVRHQEARLPSWDYIRLVEDGVGKLVATAPLQAKKLLIELLSACQQSSRYAWRAAVEQSRENGTDTPYDSLIDHLRDLLDGLVNDDAAILRDLVTELESLDGTLYTRLSLYLLSKHGALAQDLVVERASSQTLLDASETFRELSRMIQGNFGALSTTDQRRLVDALRENFSREHQQSLLGQVSDELLLAHEKSRKRKLFGLIVETADDDSVRAEYDALVAEAPPQKRPPRGLRVGPTSPLEVAELSTKSDMEVLAFLREWAPPSDDPFEDSREGLAHVLRACTAKDPERFAKLARELRGTYSGYGAAIFWGLHDAIAAKGTEERPNDSPIDFDSVLDLVEYISTQASDSSARWAKRMAVDILGDAARMFRGAETARQRTVWRALNTLLTDPDPGPERVSESGKDHVTFAVNTVRGAALDTVCGLVSELGASGATASTLTEDIVAAILARADPNNEPSHAIRAIIARHFNLLFLFDEKVRAAASALLFPAPSSHEAQQHELWRTFLEWNPPAMRTFSCLKGSYESAVANAATSDAKAASLLGEHLVMLAVSELVESNGAMELLSQFVEQAPIAARRAALNHLGRTLYNDSEGVNEGVRERLVSIWHWWEQRSLATGTAADLAAFGWWFASPKFDPSWLLSTLDRILEATGGDLDWDDEVVDKLTSLAATLPLQVTKSLARFLEYPKPHRVAQNIGAIQAAIRVLRSGPAEDDARAIASRLVARGWPEFQELAQE